MTPVDPLLRQGERKLALDECPSCHRVTLDRAQAWCSRCGVNTERVEYVATRVDKQQDGPMTVDKARELRSAGLSVREVAAALGMPRATVGGWLRGSQRGTHGYVIDCAWCGDLFYSKRPDRVYCCREHNVKAQHAKRRKVAK